MQAIGQVAQLGGFKIKKASVADDLENVTLTLTFTAISQGWHQASLDFEREDLTAHVNGRGEVERIDGLQAGDLAETGAEADAEIAAAAETPDDETRYLVTDPQMVDEAKPDVHLVGELAGAARQRRRP